MASAQVTADTLKKMKALKKTRQMRAFCAHIALHPSTFDKILRGESVRVDAVERVEQYFIPEDKPITEDAAFRVAASFFDKTEAQLRDPIRKPTTTEARLFLALILHEDGGLTKPQVSRILGYSDHTGAYQAIKALRNYLSGNDKALQARYQDFRNKVRAAC